MRKQRLRKVKALAQGQAGLGFKLRQPNSKASIPLLPLTFLQVTLSSLLIYR